MKKSVVLAAIVSILMVLGLAGCQPAAPDTNRNASLAAASPTPEPVDRAAIEAEVTKLAREWIAAAQNKDPEAVRRIVADDAILVYPDGTSATKTEEVQAIEAGAISAESFEMIESKVVVLDADTAFISGRSLLKNGKYQDPKTKRAIDLSGEYRFLDVYERRDGRWQVIASQATKVAAPAPVPPPTPASSPVVSPAQ